MNVAIWRLAWVAFSSVTVKCLLAPHHRHILKHTRPFSIRTSLKQTKKHSAKQITHHQQEDTPVALHLEAPHVKGTVTFSSFPNPSLLLGLLLWTFLCLANCTFTVYCNQLQPAVHPSHHTVPLGHTTSRRLQILTCRSPTRRKLSSLHQKTPRRLHRWQLFDRVQLFSPSSASDCG